MSLKARVRQRLTALNLTPAEASRRAGRAPTFIRDILEGRKTSIRGDSAHRLAQVLRTSIGWLLEGTGPETVDMGAFPIDTSPIRHILIVAELRSGVLGGAVPEGLSIFGKEPNGADGPLGRIAIVEPDGMADKAIVGFRVRDRSMDMFYPVNSVLSAISPDAADLLEADHVIAEIERGGLYEIVCRELVRIGRDQWALAARSYDPALQTPPAPIGPETRIVAIVIGCHIYRDRPSVAPAALGRKVHKK